MDDTSRIPFIFISLLIIGAFVAVVGAFFIRSWIANRIVNLLMMDSDDNYKVEPQYSIAKARIAAGQYEDAIDEFRKAILLYPTDLNVHFLIADVYANNLLQPLDALAELDAGQRRTRDAEVMAKFVLRKADIHLINRRDPGNAMVEIETFLSQHPTAKASILLNQKLRDIRDAQDGQSS